MRRKLTCWLRHQPQLKKGAPHVHDFLFPIQHPCVSSHPQSAPGSGGCGTCRTCADPVPRPPTHRGKHRETTGRRGSKRQTGRLAGTEHRKTGRQAQARRQGRLTGLHTADTKTETAFTQDRPGILRCCLTKAGFRVLGFGV